MSDADRHRSLTPRARQIVAVARELLEEEGVAALSMRNIAHRLGIQAPALYRHFADKREIELIIIEQGLWESGDRNLAALEGSKDPLTDILTSHRGWALEHPHVYRLSYGAPLDRERIDPGAEWHSGVALREVTGNRPDVSRAIWCFIHGIIDLELLRRFPDDSDLDGIFRTGVEALRSQL
jgi:AcrR family transcriptional regulator